MRVNELLQAQRFFSEHKNIPFVAPGSPRYDALRETYIRDSPIVPLGIARPQNAEDVATIVSFAVSHGLEFSIRTGGHDIFGRSYVQDGLCIDMRDITYVHVDDTRAVRVGGGTLALEVANKLSEHGLGTSLGSYPSVGFVGWATHGGYGPFAPNYGLGVDQISGARLVTWEGKIVDASEDMLMAIRGGGGALGVIVELTVKVYPLRMILAGIITFRSNDIRSMISRFLSYMNTIGDPELPSALGIQKSVVNTPNGKVFAIGFMWSSEDMATGEKYLQKIISFGPILENTVIETSLRDWLVVSGKLPPVTAYGAICTIRVRKETPEVAEALAVMADKMPSDPAILFSVHEVRGPSTKYNPNSVFAAREAHFLVECIGTSSSPTRSGENWAWARDLHDAIEETAKENILSGSYLPLTPPEKVNCAEVYGQNWEKFKAIKFRHDPKNVFKNALAKF